LLKKLCPRQIAASLWSLDLEDLKGKGITAIILDLDNTLLPWGSNDIPAETLRWVDKAKKLGFKLCITSNGLTGRVQQIAATLDVPAVCKAVKPRKKPFQKALELLETCPGETAVAGDQLFTDILGGNRLSLYTILTNPLSDRELSSTRLLRRVETYVMGRLLKKGCLTAGQFSTRYSAGGRERG